jgi:hypothetical protein
VSIAAALIVLQVFDSKAGFWAIMGIGLLVIVVLRLTVLR